MIKIYNVTTKGLGYFGPVYMWPNADGQWHFIWRNTLGSVGCMLILVVCYSVICLGCVKLYFFIDSSCVSRTTRRMHFELLKLLVAQATAPLIFEYLPCFLTVWGGFLGLPLHTFAYYVPITISAYPEADALLVMVFFQKYRRRCIRLLLSLYLTRDQMKERFSFSNSVSRTQTTHKNRVSSIAIGMNVFENGEHKN